MSLAKEILSMPEGKQFLAALLICVMGLVSGIVAMEIRFTEKIQNCEQDKQRSIKEVNDKFLDYVIKSNDKAEATKEKLDSINMELLKLKR